MTDAPNGYPPPHLIPRKTRITPLPMLAFAGLIESAPISYEEMTKVWAVAEHHHMQYRIQHDFGGDAEAYAEHVRKFGDRGEP